MSIIQARISDEEKDLIMQYLKTKNISVSDLIRKAIIEKIEDEIDLKLYKKAMEDFKKNPITYTLEEIKKELEL